MNRIRPSSGVFLMTALLIAVTLSAVFMGFVALGPETDMANRLIGLFILLPLVLSTIAFARALFRALFAKRVAQRWRHKGTGTKLECAARP